jgi:hypothetical protein
MKTTAARGIQRGFGSGWIGMPPSLAAAQKFSKVRRVVMESFCAAVAGGGRAWWGFFCGRAGL